MKKAYVFFKEDGKPYLIPELPEIPSVATLNPLQCIEWQEVLNKAKANALPVVNPEIIKTAYTNGNLTEWPGTWEDIYSGNNVSSPFEHKAKLIAPQQTQSDAPNEGREEKHNDTVFLEWIYERMICVHGEIDLYDYMINFKSIIDSHQQLRDQLSKEREETIRECIGTLEKHHKSVGTGDEYSKGIANAINLLHSLIEANRTGQEMKHMDKGREETQLEQDAKEYLLKQGTHDRPDITGHDFKQGWQCGYNYLRDQLSKERREKEKLKELHIHQETHLNDQLLNERESKKQMAIDLYDDLYKERGMRNELEIKVEKLEAELKRNYNWMSGGPID